MPKTKENQNVKYTTLKSKHCEVYKNDNWEKMPFNRVFYERVDKSLAAKSEPPFKNEGLPAKCEILDFIEDNVDDGKWESRKMKEIIEKHRCDIYNSSNSK